MSYVIGLTGGIGSGKTVASDYFAEIGVPVIDTDVIARKIVEPGHPALQNLVDTFGQDILLADGTLNRDALRTIAFASADNKAKLDAITHPAIRIETMQQIAATTYPYCIVVIPLLAPDTEFSGLLQRVLAVVAERETRIERVEKRSGLSRDEIERIMQTQLSDEQRLAFADDVINNNGTIAEARAAAEELHQKYLTLSL